MKKYAVLLVVIAAAFGTLSATFDSFSAGQQEPHLMFEREGENPAFEHSGFGCSYGEQA
ncbi:MAG: hypothetical protein AAF629_32440 [Chloroflexota bacterium]